MDADQASVGAALRLPAGVAGAADAVDAVAVRRATAITASLPDFIRILSPTLLQSSLAHLDVVRFSCQSRGFLPFSPWGRRWIDVA